jgi:hypothetical protein
MNGKHIPFTQSIRISMKKIIAGSIITVMSMLTMSFGQMIVPSSENYILNENDQQVLNTENINDPLRDGAYNIVG